MLIYTHGLAIGAGRKDRVMKMFDQLIAEVKEFKAKKLNAANALKKSGAPVGEVNAKKTQAANAVATLEAYIAMVNMANDKNYAVSKDQCEEYAAQNLEKLKIILAA